MREGGGDPRTNMATDEGEGTTWGMETGGRSEVTERDGATCLGGGIGGGVAST